MKQNVEKRIAPNNSGRCLALQSLFPIIFYGDYHLYGCTVLVLNLMGFLNNKNSGIYTNTIL